MLPEGFVSAFGEDVSGYKFIFSNPTAYAQLTLRMPLGRRQAPLIVIDLYMNGEDGIAEQFATEIKRHWVGYPADFVRQIGKRAREILLSGRPSWKQEVIALLPKPE